MTVRKTALSVAVAAALAAGGSLFATHLAKTNNDATVIGSLRIVSARAADISTGPVTADQALQTVLTKLATLTPGVEWDVPGVDTPRVNLISNMTTVYDSTTGRQLYSRSNPIDAWVVQIHNGQNFALGIVSDNASPLCNGNTRGCAVPGSILAVQAMVRP